MNVYESNLFDELARKLLAGLTSLLFMQWNKKKLHGVAAIKIISKKDLERLNADFLESVCMVIKSGNYVDKDEMFTFAVLSIESFFFFFSFFFVNI